MAKRASLVISPAASIESSIDRISFEVSGAVVLSTIPASRRAFGRGLGIGKRNVTSSTMAPSSARRSSPARMAAAAWETSSRQARCAARSTPSCGPGRCAG